MSEEEQAEVRRHLAADSEGFTESEIELAVRIVRTMHKHVGILGLEDARFLILIDRVCKQLSEEKDG